MFCAMSLLRERATDFSHGPGLASCPLDFLTRDLRSNFYRPDALSRAPAETHGTSVQ